LIGIEAKGSPAMKLPYGHLEKSRQKIRNARRVGSTTNFACGKITPVAETASF